MPSSASLDNHPLAFSTDDTCVPATSRIPFTTSDGILLNVEVFDYTTPNSPPDNHNGPLLLFLHGVCESTETKGVQAVVSAAKTNGVRVAVLELEGHGLSQGRRGVCTDFDRLVSHVLEFVRHAVTSLAGEDGEVPYAISGSSLGGVLSLYAAQEIAQGLVARKDESLHPGRFVGVAPISPAVGVDPRAVPSAPIVTLLKLISFLCPAVALPFTPVEDPKHYNCPKSTMRNYSGHWALGTSRMLLDVTSSRVKKDLKGKLTLEDVPSLLLVTGNDDEIVPKEAVELFFKSVKPVEKRFELVPDAGHDILVVKRTSDQVVKYLFQWLALVCQ